MTDIELVIKIPSNYMNYIDKYERGSLFDSVLTNAIKTGIPLPKGHGDLKDVDPIIDMLQRTRTYSLQQSIDIEQFKKDLYNAQTIIEADKEEG